ncbi:uncharacterized protein KZ484_025847 [Pholidichthys leucotaenia]
MKLLLLSLTCLSCVSAQYLLAQFPPHLTVSRGENVSLYCNVTGMGVENACTKVAWLHIHPVSGLKVVYPRGQGSMMCLLNIPSAALKDTGRYYCILMEGVMPFPGNGTTLVVSESEHHSPTLDILVPSDIDASRPVPLICQASGLEDLSRAKVDWNVDLWKKNGEDEVHDVQRLNPRILPDIEGVVLSSQVYVPVGIWSAGVEVTCVLTDGKLRIRKSVSSKKGMSSLCLIMTSIIGPVCIILLGAVLMLSILLSRQRRNLSKYSDLHPQIFLD